MVLHYISNTHPHVKGLRVWIMDNKEAHLPKLKFNFLLEKCGSKDEHLRSLGYRRFTTILEMDLDLTQP